jgi:signal transduction histidine kinase
MGGSPVRGQNKTSITPLNSAKDTQKFQDELLALIRNDLPSTKLFFGMVDRQSQVLQVPAWVRSHLEKHPGLAAKLAQGAMVGISHADENPVPRPVAAARSSVVLIPVVSDETLYGAIGLISPLDGPQLSAEEIESVRQLAHDAAPILARLQEIESLRLKTQELQTVAQNAGRVQAGISKTTEEKNQLDALLKIGAHVQSNIAHELRTPLAAIRGYARMILDGRAGEINDTQRDYLRVINENTNRLINVANWMTHLADLGSQQFKLAPCDLSQIWAEAIRSNQEALTHKSLNLTERIPSESFEIIADREKLLQALNQLIAAAAILSEPKSAITAEFSHGREREVMVKLSLSSASIAPEALHRTFDHAINNAVTTRPLERNEGTAGNAMQVDLRIVHEAIAIHGGRIFVNSTPGQGATFLFTLPAVTIGGEEKNHEQAVNISRR